MLLIPAIKPIRKKEAMRLTTATAARRATRSNKAYKLVGDYKDMRPSVGRTILASIARRHGRATTQSLRKDMKRGASDATLRFYLGKFQREGLVVAVGA